MSIRGHHYVFDSPLMTLLSRFGRSVKPFTACLHCYSQALLHRSTECEKDLARTIAGGETAKPQRILIDIADKCNSR